MPTLARPEVDVLDGLTTAIIVDQQRMGADARSTVGTATNAFSFNVPLRRAHRASHRTGVCTVARENPTASRVRESSLARNPS
jgi:excinuclease UvrABC ATPase subunit